MGRPSKHRRLGLWANGVFVGTWTLTPTGRSELRYDSRWVESHLARPLSLSVPLPLPGDAATFVHEGETVTAWFENLLPDDAAIRRRVASRFGVGDDSFELLAAIGRDCIGALQLLPDAAAPPDWRRIDATPMREADVEHHLDAVLRGAPFAAGMEIEDEFRLSLAGAQEKSALLHHAGRWMRPRGATPTTHILKLPLGDVGAVRADFSRSVDNEWVCLALARGFGLDAAHAHIESFGRHRVLVVERFDRRWHEGTLLRLPQEDFCQALGVASARKYESAGGPGLRQMAQVLRAAVDPQKDLRNLMATQLLFWLLRAPDGHAKNFSIALLAGSRFALTPLYDVLSAHPVLGTGPNQFHPRRMKLAMALSGKSRHYRFADIGRRHFVETARTQGFLGLDANPLIDEFVATAPAVVEAVRASAPPDLDARTLEVITDGVLRCAREL